MTTTGTDQGKAVRKALDPYLVWIEGLGVPIHTGYYLEDGRTVPVGPWAERECDAVFLRLAGQEGVVGNYITEIAPGKTLPPYRMALDEVVYCLEGRGIATIWAEGRTPKSFEWSKHSMFLLPGGYYHRLGNMQGGQAARLLHHNYLPLAMSSLVQDVDFFLDNPKVDLNKLYGDGDFYSTAKTADATLMYGHQSATPAWVGNFFPDMRAWDKLDPLVERGAGGLSVQVAFPGSPITAHMSVFPPLTYKKAHRHGPGLSIVIPAGEGYSIMWHGSDTRVVIPWHEGSIFVPPNRWWHQHFNVSNHADRYLALHPPRLMIRAGAPEDLSQNQIEYVHEDPWVRQKFDEELGKRGLKAAMPAEAYRDPDYRWVDMNVG